MLSKEDMLDAIRRRMKPSPVKKRVAIQDTQAMTKLPVIPQSVRDELSKKIGMKGLEIECSVGTFSSSGNYQPGLRSAQAFMRLKKKLENDGSKITVESSTVSIDDSGIRRVKVKNGKTYYEKKTKDLENQHTDKHWGFRINSSIEKRLKTVKNFKSKFKRWRVRFSCVHEDFPGVRFDLTIVDSFKKNNKPIRTFEVEIESISESHDVFDVMEKSLTYVFKNTSNLPLIQRAAIFKVHNGIFNNFADDKMIGKYENKPINLKLTDFITKMPEIDRRYAIPEWAITVKYDGIRKFLFCWNGKLFLLYPPYDIQYIGPVKNRRTCLLDGELIENEGEKQFYAFDVLFYDGDHRHKSFDIRLKVLNDAVKNIQSQHLTVVKKKYYMEDKENLRFYSTADVIPKKDVYHYIGNALDDSLLLPADGIFTDGIILQPIKQTYSQAQVKKWKPKDQLTIDFLFKKKKGASKGEFSLYVGARDKKTGKTTTQLFKKGKMFDGTIKIDSDRQGDVPYEGFVVECVWAGKTFEPERIRFDKREPNFIDVANSVWRDIQNPITSDDIRGNTLAIMRKYHNKIKENILYRSFTQGQTILDIGSGRGGDINKWNKIGLKKVYAVDPDEENRQEMMRRIATSRNLKTDVEVLNMGAESDKLDEYVDEKIDGVVSFFSLTFFPKSKNMYMGLIKNVSSLLESNGKFVGIMMDGNAVRELLEKHNGHYEGHAFSIKGEDIKGNKIGDEIILNIKDAASVKQDQVEFLVYFNELEKSLKNQSVILKNDALLNMGDEFKALPKESQLFSSMNRQFSFFKRAKGVRRKEKKDEDDSFDREIAEALAMVDDDDSEEIDYGDEEYSQEVEDGSQEVDDLLADMGF